MTSVIFVKDREIKKLTNTIVIIFLNILIITDFMKYNIYTDKNNNN